MAVSGMFPPLYKRNTGRDIEKSEILLEMMCFEGAKKIFPASGIISEGTFSSKIPYYYDLDLPERKQVYTHPLAIIESLFKDGEYTRVFEPYDINATTNFSSIDILFENWFEPYDINATTLRSLLHPKLVFNLKQKKRNLRGKMACNFRNLLGSVIFYEAVVGKRGSDTVYILDRDSVREFNLFERIVKEKVGVEYDENEIRSSYNEKTVTKQFSTEDALKYLARKLK